MSEAGDERLLFSPFALGRITLSNRIVMAPMTRSRATLEDNRPGPLALTYYVQRASAGLIVAEGTQTSRNAKGFPRIPGLFAKAQVDEWRAITDAVHTSGGAIFAQLWHCGRISHHRSQPDGALPAAPSAIRAEGMVMLDDGTRLPTDTPRAFATAELPALIDEYVTAARNAIAAGFDGVELHSANGYLLHQFLSEASNQRTDFYGGSPENRARFVIETADAVASAIGADRTGIRLSPVSRYNDIGEDDPTPTYAHLLGALDRIGLAYVHMVEGHAGVSRDPVGFDFVAARKQFGGAWIVNNMYDAALAEEALREGRADLVSFGRPFIANPDLVARLRHDAPLAEVDFTNAYAGGEAGYIDYPNLAELHA
jgi:N-ethylmaleimide reductase